MKKVKDITEGNILFNILYMGIPSMVGFSAMTIYGLINIYWVGRLGTLHVAAVTLVGSILWVFSSFNQIVGTGSVALIARRYGEKRFEETARVIKQTMLLKIIIPILFIYPLVFFLEKVMILMQADKEVIKFGIDYGIIVLLGQPPIFLAFTIYTALRGIGEAPKSMYIMLFSTILNFILDPILMLDLEYHHIFFGFSMGIKGAALSTIISSLVSIVIGLYLFCSGKVNLDFQWKKDWLFDFKTMFSIMKIGLPAGIENFVRSFSAWVIMLFISSFGSIVVTAFGFSRRILELSVMFSIGLGMGNSAIVGQCLGAKKPERADKTATVASKTIFIFQTIFSLLEIIYAKQIVALFSSDPQVIETGIVILSIMCLFQPFVGAQIVYGSTFKGAGNTLPPLVITSMTHWLMEVPLVIILIKFFNCGASYIWYASVFAQVVGFLNIYIWFKQGRWKLKKV